MLPVFLYRLLRAFFSPLAERYAAPCSVQHCDKRRTKTSPPCPGEAHMSERKTPWTPGPWRLDDNKCDVLAGRNRHLASIWLPQELDPAELQIANARLIAEAPAMAELLAEWMDYVSDPAFEREHTRPFHRLVDEARVLLARIGAP